MQNAAARLLARAKGSLDGSTADLPEINQIRCCGFHQRLLPVRSAVRSLCDGEPTRPTSAAVAHQSVILHEGRMEASPHPGPDCCAGSSREISAGALHCCFDRMKLKSPEIRLGHPVCSVALEMTCGSSGVFQSRFSSVHEGTLTLTTEAAPL